MNLLINNPRFKWTITFLYIVFSTSFCVAQKQAGKDSAGLALDQITRLPEIKAYLHHADSLYHGTGVDARIILQAEPSKETPYYWIQVGIYHDDMLTPEFNFYVYPKNMQVKFLDTVHDRILSLAEWRKTRQWP